MKTKKGFTLLELMIAISIFSIFSTFLYKAYFDQLKSYRNFTSKIQVQNNAETIINKFTSLIRNCIIIDSNNTTNLIFSRNTNGEIINIIAKNVPLIENGTSNIKDINIISISPNSTSSQLNLDTTLKTLKYNDGTLLCKNIKSLLIENTQDILNITLTLTYGKNNNEQYYLKTGINIRR